ncbi:MAG: hydroxyacid dehydrogenase, partial [Woeseiaceae bacterium]|nr:hydroxyacid dehydrogenase [Woeseiaceae bacterium]
LTNAGALVADAVLAKNKRESDALWRMRHAISEAEKKEGPGAKFDISVPIGRIAEFLQVGADRMSQHIPEARPAVFGHIGDGNLHYNSILPAGMTADEIGELRRRINTLVYDLVAEFDGSISAEHGIGSVKRDLLAHYKSPAEIAVMRTLKQALDPQGILNPGKVI